MSSEFKEEITSVGSGPSGEWARVVTGTGLRKQNYLLAIAGARAGKRYRLGRETHLGRDSGAHIHLAGAEVSRRHLRLSLLPDGECLLEDLGSRNGTLVNGLRVDKHRLHPGDLIQVGDEDAFLFTQQSALEELILQEQRMESVARVTAGLAHEFSDLISAVLSELELLRQRITQGASSDQLVEGIKSIEAATRRAVRLTDKVLGLGFARRGAATDRRPVDLQGIAEEIVSLLKPSFSSITFHLEIASALNFAGDAGLLEQALMNLCLQACEEMQVGGMLAIRAEAAAGDPHDEGHVIISVMDSGPGHTEEESKTLFAPLFGGAPGLGSRPGLVAVYEAVQRHGGRIEVDSDPGRGTTFRLIVPTGVPAEYRSRITSPGLPAVPRTVLLVEDVEAQRASATRILEGLGMRVLQARDGREAIRLFTAKRTQIDVVVLDLILPNLSGKETFRWLRKISPDVKVVLTSAYLDSSRVPDLLSLGACSFLPKPYEAAPLRLALEEVLGPIPAISSPELQKPEEEPEPSVVPRRDGRTP